MAAKKSASETVRCAIYTRVSTAGQAEGDFSSIDNQREAGEAYVKAQAGNGWQALDQRFDDAGFSGSNTDRPALARLLAAIDAGEVDLVVVYKIDRLSRSLLDFARMMDRLERARVSLVSVTQQFDTSSSMGKLTLNMLLSFAQFEREMIAERTRDKVLAARRRGKWTGGPVPLGFDLIDGHLIPNADEADRVRAIFELYLELGSLTATVAELRRRGWTTKAWKTKSGRLRRGRAFTVDSLRRLLRNPAYLGKIRCGAEVHEAEHSAVLDGELFEIVQARLRENANDGGRRVRNVSGALLKGLLRCAACDTAMTPVRTRKNGRSYRYYRCSGSMKGGAATCPASSLPAAEIEAAVYEQIQRIGQNPDLVEATIAATIAEREEQLRQHEIDLAAASRQEGSLRDHARRLATAIGSGGRMAKHAVAALDDVERQQVETRIRREELERLREQLASVEIDADALRRAVAEFAPIWEVLEPGERTRLARELIEQVDYDGTTGEAAITFRHEALTALPPAEPLEATA